jgi:HPt (histidine-containing phosphotransfer) domain-containing protein
LEKNNHPESHSLSEDGAFQKKAKSIMLKEIPKAIEQFRTAFEQQEYDTIRNIAHKLRPNLLLIGYPKQSIYMGEIEQNTDQTLLQFAMIQKELEGVLARLQEVKD